jgi:hypothetical protein
MGKAAGADLRLLFCGRILRRAEAEKDAGQDSSFLRLGLEPSLYDFTASTCRIVFYVQGLK